MIRIQPRSLIGWRSCDLAPSILHWYLGIGFVHSIRFFRGFPCSIDSEVVAAFDSSYLSVSTVVTGFDLHEQAHVSGIQYKIWSGDNISIRMIDLAEVGRNMPSVVSQTGCASREGSVDQIVYLFLSQLAIHF